jgi:ribosomal protein S18 acetylase RimI-like enzyme
VTTGDQAATTSAARNAPEWELRAARPDDADECAAVAVVAWQRVFDSYAAILGTGLYRGCFVGWEARKARDVGSFVRRHPEQALVAEANGAVVGFVTFQHDDEDRIGTLGNNAVHPEWQGRGIAAALYQAALARMRSNGMRVVRVTTGLDEGHAPARAAYRKAGFTVGLPSITYYQDIEESAEQEA